MKKAIHVLILLTVATPAFSQDTVGKLDTLIRKNGDEISGKVTEVTSGYIVFQMEDSSQSINQVILLEDVFMIKYANGTRELIAQRETEKNTDPKFTPEEMYAKGQSDARMSYKGNGAMWGTAGSTIIFPPFGLIEGIVSASISPKIEKQDITDRNLLKDENYVAGYKKQAHKKKVKKVVTGFGIAAGTYVIIWVTAVGLAAEN